MGCAVEAVLSYVQLLVILIGEAEHISLGGHSGMECGVEHNSHRNIGHNGLTSTQCQCCAVVVNGSKLCQSLYLVDDLIGDYLRL